MRTPAPRNLDSLNPFPEVPVDDRLMGLEVDPLPEVNLTEVDAGAKHLLDPVVAPLDSVGQEEGADLFDRCARNPYFKCTFDCPHTIWGCVRFKGAAGTADVPRRHPRMGKHSSRHSTRLSGPGPLPRCPTLVGVHGPQQSPREPLCGSPSADLPDVECQDTSPCSFNPGDDLLLHREGTDESVQVGRDDHLSLSRLDGFHGSSQAMAFLQRSTPRDVKLLDRADELQPVALTGVLDLCGLFTRGGKRLALAASHLRNPNDAQRPPHRCAILRQSVESVSSAGVYDSIHERLHGNETPAVALVHQYAAKRAIRRAALATRPTPATQDRGLGCTSSVPRGVA